MTVIRTVRHAYEVCDKAGSVLAEVVDDRVTVLDDSGATTGTFRELEVELKAGDRKLLDRVGAVLREAGAQGGSFTPKHVRALGATAQADPDLVAPAGLTVEPSAGDVVTEAVRKEIRRLLAHDPLVRLRAPAAGGHTAVHQMRVACRRLRSDLRTFKPLIRKTWSRPLRTELRWLAGVLGAARDAEVLRERLRRTASADPLSPSTRARWTGWTRCSPNGNSWRSPPSTRRYAPRATWPWWTLWCWPPARPGSPGRRLPPRRRRCPRWWPGPGGG